MTYEAHDLRSVVLRLEFSVADAVTQRGLFPVLVEAVRAWWTRPRLPPNLPAHLRADVGLPPEGKQVYWMDIPISNPKALRLPPM